MSLQIEKLTADGRKDNASVQFGQPESLGVTDRNMGEGLLIVGEMTQRQAHHQGSSQHGRWLREAGTVLCRRKLLYTNGIKTETKHGNKRQQTTVH